MSGSTSSYLLYCAAGLILSTLVTLLFEVYPTIRVASDGGVVFGIMCAILLHAIKNPE